MRGTKQDCFAQLKLTHTCSSIFELSHHFSSTAANVYIRLSCMQLYFLFNLLLSINSKIQGWKEEMHVAYRLITGYCFNSIADCGAPPPPVNGSLLQAHTNTTDGSVVVFQCDPGFVPEGMMTAECGRDGRWTPNPGHVTCSPRSTPTSTHTFTETSIVTSISGPTGPGESQLLLLYNSLYKF